VSFIIIFGTVLFPNGSAFVSSGRQTDGQTDEVHHSPTATRTVADPFKYCKLLKYTILVKFATFVDFCVLADVH